jgi:hypothetical protein
MAAHSNKVCGRFLPAGFPRSALSKANDHQVSQVQGILVIIPNLTGIFQFPALPLLKIPEDSVRHL